MSPCGLICCSADSEDARKMGRYGKNRFDLSLGVEAIY
jgi:hypothetical protein